MVVEFLSYIIEAHDMPTARQWLFRATLCITLKIKIWVVAYFFNFFQLLKKKKKMYKSHFM